MRCIFLNPHPPEHSSGFSGFPSLQRNRLLPRQPASANIALHIGNSSHRLNARKLEGQITWSGEVVLDVWALVDFQSGRILKYSYEVHKQGEKIVWYDPFEHPREPSLASSFPHHKHVPPDINHHRVPAPGISFEQPNLPFLIEEIEREVLSSVA